MEKIKTLPGFPSVFLDNKIPMPTVSRFLTPAFVVIFGDALDDLNGGNVVEHIRPLITAFFVAGAMGFVSGTVAVRAHACDGSDAWEVGMEGFQSSSYLLAE